MILLSHSSALGVEGAQTWRELVHNGQTENTLEEKVESPSEGQEEPRQLEIEESPAHESPQKSEEKMEEELIDENSEIDNSEMETESKPNDETKVSYSL